MFWANKSGSIGAFTHMLAAVADVPTLFFLEVWSHTTPKQFAPALHCTSTHTYRQLLSICELEAMRVCNDATWQPIKQERDEDAIRLSSTPELLPTKQMEGAEVYFWRERRLFRVSGWFLRRHSTQYETIERWWLLCVISCVVCWPWFDSAERTRWR